MAQREGVKLVFWVTENRLFLCKLSREKVRDKGLRIVILIVFGVTAGGITICMRSLLGSVLLMGLIWRARGLQSG
ncbi:hypothetical protein ME9_01597 [Bartonella taylorii 8TBB]|uniref:Uncharacterized protein n=1 Tax=Bartonella taylorii 8TBB TaxID=1094560 RepID=A0A9P2W2G6_BARTA|nr:hypothetical protein ME9_01597 [Bartonella taylorii 8TBB]OPB35370.1 hypothetical protein Btaycd_005410 [Bartonella taylorii]